MNKQQMQQPANRSHNHYNIEQTSLSLIPQATAPKKSPSISYLNAADMEMHQQQGSAEHTTSSVELSLSCQNLPDCDIVTKSDPQIIVYLLDLAGREKLCEIGRTEVIQDDLNPKFVKKILLQYHFEQIQRLRFEVFDIDPVGGNDFLGGLSTTLADIVASRSSTFKQALEGGPKRRRQAFLIVEAEELIACKQVATFSLSAHDLPSSFCGLLAPSSSVFIYRSNENGTMTIVHKSPTVNRDSNPRFASFTQKLVTLCNGDLDRSIRFELIDRRLNMDRRLGYFEATVNSLKANKGQAQVFNLMHKRGKRLSEQIDHESHKVVMSDFKIINQASFLDYIRAGAQIHFVIAIDFTASNGDPNYPDSLHYLDPMRRRMNPYEQALLSVGQIIKPYDTTGLFAGFGFGAKLLGSSRPPSHLFPLNGNEQHPYVDSIEGLLEVYRAKLRNVILSGPTNFAPCIAHCSSIANQFEDGNHYFVLLIVTDGIISDMLQTKKAIIEASRGPLSIIICGVGDAEFSAMDELDSDDVVMRVDGKAAERDIVQFVPMNKFAAAAAASSARPSATGDQHRAPSGGVSPLELQRLLAEEVLREIPDQLTGYMLQRGFHPELTSLVE